jgi:cyclase
MFRLWGEIKMNIVKVGNRGVLFNYEDGDCPIGGGTSVYLINTENKLFLCDTHMGYKSMDVIKEYIKENNLSNKELIIFNSHSDWDHIWGNCAFEKEMIIGHEKCRRIMKQTGGYFLNVLGKYKNGAVEIKYPQVTFNNKLSFEDEGIEFIYAPGHTECSAICYDKKDSAVFVGDLAEEPYPTLIYGDWDNYVKSLEFIKSLNPNFIITAHSGIVSENLVDENIKYIKDFIRCYELNDTSGITDKKILSNYNRSINTKLILEYEKIIKKKLGDKFDHISYKREFWSSIGVKYEDLDNEYRYIRNINHEDLKQAFKNYIEKL